MNFMSYFQNDFQVILPEIFLSIAILTLLLYGTYSTVPAIASSTLSEAAVRERYEAIRFSLVRRTNYLSVLVLIITIFLVVVDSSPAATIFNRMLISDSLSDLVKVMVLVGAIASILISNSYLKYERIFTFEYSLLILLAVLGLLLLASSYDLIAMYLAIELQSLSLYILAALKRNSEFSTEAGLKYFILGAFSSGLLLFGSSLLYGFTGLTNFGDFLNLFVAGFGSDLMTSNLQIGGITVGIIFVSAALLFKAAAVPFHMWAPDVYEGAPTSVTAFFAITPKIAILTVFIRFYAYAFHPIVNSYGTREIIIAISIASMVVGALGALYQTKIKRVLAYSAIGHIGYMLIGLAVATPESIQALLTYSIIYMVTTIGMFAAVLSLYNQKTQLNIKYISQLRALGKTNPALAFTIAAMLFSLAGIPPLAGFYGKLYIFMAAVQASMYFLAIIGVLTSVIGAFYYIRIIKIMYFYENDYDFKFLPITTEQALVLAITTFLVVFFCLYPTPLLELTLKVSLFL